MKTVCVRVEEKEYNFRLTMKALNDLSKNNIELFEEMQKMTLETIMKILMLSSIEKISLDEAYEFCDLCIDEGWGLEHQSALIIEIMRCSGLLTGYSEDTFNLLEAMGIQVLRKYINPEKILTDEEKEIKNA